jgi:hypothetical protein
MEFAADITWLLLPITLALRAPAGQPRRMCLFELLAVVLGLLRALAEAQHKC